METTLPGKPRSFSYRVRQLLVLIMLTPVIVSAADAVNRQQQMLDEIAADFRNTGHLTGRHRMTAELEQVMSRVPRHEFVPAGQAARAYANRPLSIGHGQTISQPFIVALMTDLLDVEAGSRVLEIGTGSGYQAAILAEMAASVDTIEIIPELAETAAGRLAALGYTNVHVHTGDGNYGWPAGAPYDRIIVTAGGRLPPKLREQLSVGGKLIVPLDHESGDQVLTLFDKAEDGAVSQRVILPVRFVPITGDN